MRNIATRDAFAPVSWPEVHVLREVHGAEAIMDVEPFVDVKQTAKAERERLSMKYGDEVLAQLWGGKNAPPELVASGARLKPDVVWLNPLSGQMEKTTAKGSEPYTPPPEERKVAEVVGDYAVREAEAETEEEDPYSEYDQPEEAEEEAQAEDVEEEKIFGQAATLKKPAAKSAAKKK
jgi:hypothetical protein